MKIRYLFLFILSIFCFNFSFAQNISLNLDERLEQKIVEKQQDDMSELFKNAKKIEIPFNTTSEVKNVEIEKKTTIEPTVGQLEGKIKIKEEKNELKDETFLGKEGTALPKVEITDDYYKVEKENVEKIIKETEEKILEKDEKIVKQFNPSFDTTIKETIRNFFTFPFLVLLSLLMILTYLVFYKIIPLKYIVSYLGVVFFILLGISLSIFPTVKISNYWFLPIVVILGYILYFSYKNYFIYMNTLQPLNKMVIDNKKLYTGYGLVLIVSYFILSSIHFTRNPIIGYWNNSFSNLNGFDIQNLLLNNVMIIGLLALLFGLLYFYYKKDKELTLKIIIFFTFVFISSIIFLFI